MVRQIEVSQTDNAEALSREHQAPTQRSSGSRDSDNDDSDNGRQFQTSSDITDSASSDDDDDDDDDDGSDHELPPPVIFSHPLVDDLLDRFMRAQLQPDININNNKSNNNNSINSNDSSNILAGKKESLEPAPIHVVDLKFDELRQLCDLAMNSFSKQKSLLRIGNEMLPITICADIHGQFRDIRCILSTCGNPSSQTYLFLGDYVDRGAQGIETITMLMCFKIKYPTRVYMLRGNHEDANTTLIYGFYDECVARFPKDEGELLPRPSIVPPYGLMCDILWSDPDDRYPGWALSARGISFTFSSKIIKEFCETNKIDLIVRGHQLTADMFKGGYKYFAGGRLITIFSAPNYLNMRNDSCVLHISRKFKCHFTVFRPIFAGTREVQNGKDEAQHAAPIDGC
uniref:Serine/threonine-protein phosphatase n=1 Tax=Setaria digitata TaxID=48799 RepID=A0A915PIG9_9BILA